MNSKYLKGWWMSEWAVRIVRPAGWGTVEERDTAGQMSSISDKPGLKGLELSWEQMSRRQVSVSGGNTGAINIDTLELLRVKKRRPKTWSCMQGVPQLSSVTGGGGLCCGLLSRVAGLSYLLISFDSWQEKSERMLLPTPSSPPDR